MKRHAFIITLFAVAAFAMGCDKEQTTSQQIEKVKAETKEAAQEMKDYTFAQKAEFTEKMQGHLAEINKDMEQLAAKIEKSSDAVKAEAKPKLQALREQKKVNAGAQFFQTNVIFDADALPRMVTLISGASKPSASGMSSTRRTPRK